MYTLGSTSPPFFGKSLHFEFFFYDGFPYSIILWSSQQAGKEGEQEGEVEGEGELVHGGLLSAHTALQPGKFAKIWV